MLGVGVLLVFTKFEISNEGMGEGVNECCD